MDHWFDQWPPLHHNLVSSQLQSQPSLSVHPLCCSQSTSQHNRGERKSPGFCSTHWKLSAVLGNGACSSPSCILPLCRSSISAGCQCGCPATCTLPLHQYPVPGCMDHITVLFLLKLIITISLVLFTDGFTHTAIQNHSLVLCTPPPELPTAAGWRGDSTVPALQITKSDRALPYLTSFKIAILVIFTEQALL